MGWGGKGRVVDFHAWLLGGKPRRRENWPSTRDPLPGTRSETRQSGERWIGISKSGNAVKRARGEGESWMGWGNLVYVERRGSVRWRSRMMGGGLMGEKNRWKRQEKVFSEWEKRRRGTSESGKAASFATEPVGRCRREGRKAGQCMLRFESRNR